MTVFAVLPATLLGQLGGDLSKLVGINSILLSAILGGIGGLAGLGTNKLAKDWSTPIKVTTLVAFFVVFGVLIRILLAPKTDEQLVAQDWVGQQIGGLHFESPSKLSLTSSTVPEATSNFYKSLEVYTDGNEDRLVMFLNSEILVDTLDLVDSFSGSLDGMLNNMGVTEMELLDDHYMDDEEIAAKFSFQVGNKEVVGFGYMRNVGRQLQSIWLMPVKRGFSIEFIDRLQTSIVPEQ